MLSFHACAGGTQPCQFYGACSAPENDAEPPKVISDQDLSFMLSLDPVVSVIDLRIHILGCYQKAMAKNALKYNCLQSLYFLLPAINDNPLYSTLLGWPIKDLWIDLGCGQATDVRKIRQDGWPQDNILAIDINTFLWEFGLELFRDRSSAPAPFIEADVLHPPDLSPGGPLYPYLGEAVVVHVQAVVHLLDEPTIHKFLEAAGLLMKPAGTILGGHCGVHTPRLMHEVPAIEPRAWLHSPTSFKAVLEQAGFCNVVIDMGPFDDFLMRRGFVQSICDARLGTIKWMNWSAQKS